jgi:hypothetical protein
MKRITLITLILGTALAVAPAANAIVWSDGGGSPSAYVQAPAAGMSKAEYRALLIRGEALNQKYGLASSTGISRAEYRALKIRGEALNQKYGLGSSTTPEVTDGWTNSISPSTTFQPDILGGNGGVSTATPTATGGDSFAWGPVGIGAATLVGVMLLALASLAITRRRHVPSF